MHEEILFDLVWEGGIVSPEIKFLSEVASGDLEGWGCGVGVGSGRIVLSLGVITQLVAVGVGEDEIRGAWDG
jgi:hypothetical protein